MMKQNYVADMTDSLFGTHRQTVSDENEEEKKTPLNVEMDHSK